VPESSKTGPMKLLLLNFASKLILPSMSNGMSSCVLVLSITRMLCMSFGKVHISFSLLGHCIGTLWIVMESCAVDFSVVMVCKVAKMGARKARPLRQLHSVPLHHISYHI